MRGGQRWVMPGHRASPAVPVAVGAVVPDVWAAAPQRVRLLECERASGAVCARVRVRGGWALNPLSSN